MLTWAHMMLTNASISQHLLTMVLPQMDHMCIPLYVARTRVYLNLDLHLGSTALSVLSSSAAHGA
jgi:hypothetical protein